MAEITLHPESRILIRPAIVEVDDTENEVIVGMGTAQEISFEQLVEALTEAMDETINGWIDSAIGDAISGPITSLVNSSINNAIDGPVTNLVNNSINNAIDGPITSLVGTAISNAIDGPITDLVNNTVDNAIDELDKLTPQAAPTIEVGEEFDQTDLQEDFDNLVDALVDAGVLTEEP